MLVAFLALLAFLGGVGGKSAKNVECAKEEILENSDRITKHLYLLLVYNINEFGVVPHQSRIAAAKKTARPYKIF